MEGDDLIRDVKLAAERHFARKCLGFGGRFFALGFGDGWKPLGVPILFFFVF